MTEISQSQARMLVTIIQALSEAESISVRDWIMRSLPKDIQDLILTVYDEDKHAAYDLRQKAQELVRKEAERVARHFAKGIQEKKQARKK